MREWGLEFHRRNCRNYSAEAIFVSFDKNRDFCLVASEFFDLRRWLGDETSSPTFSFPTATATAATAAAAATAATASHQKNDKLP